MLAAMVAAGELPPVDERLPIEPKVLEPLEEIGTYGGTIEVFANANHPWNDLADSPERSQYPLRMNFDGSIEADQAKAYDLTDDFMTFTLYLRGGHEVVQRRRPHLRGLRVREVPDGRPRVDRHLGLPGSGGHRDRHRRLHRAAQLQGAISAHRIEHAALARQRLDRGCAEHLAQAVAHRVQPERRRQGQGGRLRQLGGGVQQSPHLLLPGQGRQQADAAPVEVEGAHHHRPHLGTQPLLLRRRHGGSAASLHRPHRQPDRQRRDLQAEGDRRRGRLRGRHDHRRLPPAEAERGHRQLHGQAGSARERRRRHLHLRARQPRPGEARAVQQRRLPPRHVAGDRPRGDQRDRVARPGGSAPGDPERRRELLQVGVGRGSPLQPLRSR